MPAGKIVAALAGCMLVTAAAAAERAASPEAGTSIIGDHENAVGLFLAPWQEDRASDLDWPPMHARAAALPLDARRLAEQLEFEAQRDASRRAHLQDRN